ncbi:hypothetical protein PHSY_001042 [Pseudozyma hubeiensis SY62]|uniref:Uncharacterized protein n=1 Tax=Pseudozyma hubeiensis (strain SY62) TaxID=1305764 RepID=R9NY23_PSEHS|nr:hypothetical protein PHSY_001042 [Pseudozyma hubeiensis SY62]GAC93477.1 hypothetical protein PHSY_001042 [Pseudozyma hubeiensis SY62]
MDENPDYDYEMEPQATTAVFQATIEEAMDERSSEGMSMSDSGSRFEALEKAAIDVDFNDALTPQQPAIPLTNLINEASQFKKDDTIDSIPTPSALQTPTAQHLGDDTATVHASHTVENGAAASEAAIQDATNRVGVEHDGARLGAMPDSNAKEHEQVDELHLEEHLAAPPNGASDASALEESDQLEEDNEDNVDVNAEQGGLAQKGYTYLAPEEGPDTAIRVSFHGQDFVMWSPSDIPAFLIMSDTVEENDPGHEAGDFVQVEAPALQVAKDVLWQPLDSLFTGLRDKSALGEFLDESHELHIAFPDLDLDVAEDNLYCREITLDDLLQLHRGLGLETSLHIQVSERPRFITKYNELAQHVASILGNQLQHSSDDEEEAANSGDRVRDADALVEPLLEAEGVQTQDEGVDGGDGDQVEPSTIVVGIASAKPDVEASPHEASGVKQGQEYLQRAYDSPDAQQQENEKELQTEGEELGQGQELEHDEGVVGSAGDFVPGDEEEHEKVTLDTEEARGESEGSLDGEVEPDAAQAEEAEGEERQDFEQVEENEEDDVEAEDEDEDREQAVEEVEAEEEEEGQGREDEEEYAEEEEEEYADEAEEDGQDAEQTFYTTVNSGSEAEEDELEDPEQGDAHDAAYVQAAEDHGSTYAYEQAGDELEWQGTYGDPSFLASRVLQSTSADQSMLSVPFAVSTEDEAEEQIVEYTEEPQESNVDAGSPSSTASTSYQTGALRKRGLDDEDEDAAYEQDDYETESKRVKVL